VSNLLDDVNSLGCGQIDLDMAVIRSNIKSGRAQFSNWPDYSQEELEESNYDKVNLIGDSDTDLLSMLSTNISDCIQFPVNSVFMHGLAILSSAMTKGFSYKYNGNGPVTIYSVISQPPSTGKSGVHGAFFHPIRVAFEGYNKSQSKKRGVIEFKISTGKSELKKCPENEVEARVKSIEDLESQLEETPIYRYSVSDATPEALVQGALRGGGMFNVLSDEASAISSVLGEMYGTGGTTNSEGVLKGWDGEYVSISRVGSGDIQGFVRGSIAVLAQDGTIESILAAAGKGNGVSERFFLLQEANLFGYRNRRREGRAKRNESLHSKYANLVAKLVNTDDFVFTINDASLSLIDDAMELYEPLMKDGEKYSHGMMRGVCGKFDKRVVKVSCVLHVAKNWDAKGGPDTVDTECVKRAIHICQQMMGAYEKTAKSEGYIGESAECLKVIELLSSEAARGKRSIVGSDISNRFKDDKVFKGKKKLATYALEKIAPKLQSMGYCCIVGKKWYINPKLARG
jgi:hypothetical protein